MKRMIVTSLLLSLCLMVSPISAWSNSKMSPWYYSIEKTCFRSVDIAWVIFKNTITIQKDTVAVIYCGDEIVTTGKLLYENYNDEGYLDMDFDLIYLPKGKDYRLYLPAGVVASEKDPTVVNSEINYEFSVPEYMPWCEYSIANNSTVASLETAVFHFRDDIDGADNQYILSDYFKAILYREDVPVRRIYSKVGGDWDIMFVECCFGNRMNFEKGVNYSLVLPEGAVHSMYREDLVNKEERMNFVGGSDKSFPELKHSWCNLDGVKTIGALNEVQWIYNSKVALSLAPSIELRNEAGELLKSVVPTLTENGGKWILSADFEGYTINPAETYHLILPESTVVTPSGDVVVNKRSTIRIVKGETGIDDVTDASVTITCANNLLRIEGTTPGDHITLYTMAGSAIATLQADGSTVTLDLPQPGIYVVVVNGKAHKVVNR